MEGRPKAAAALAGVAGPSTYRILDGKPAGSNQVQGYDCA